MCLSGLRLVRSRVVVCGVVFVIPCVLPSVFVCAGVACVSPLRERLRVLVVVVGGSSPSLAQGARVQRMNEIKSF